MNPSRQVIHSGQAPAAVGPYSQAIVSGGFVFTSGQIPLDPATGQMAPGGIREQTAQCLRNLSAVLSAAGCGLSDAVRITVFCTDLAHFTDINEVYASFFSQGTPPARSCVQVTALPKGALIEIEATAVCPPGPRPL